MPKYGLGYYPICNFDKHDISVVGYDFDDMMYEGKFL